MGTSETRQIFPLSGDQTVFRRLARWTDYEIITARADETTFSALRFFRIGEYPGRIINYLHPKDTQYAFSGRALRLSRTAFNQAGNFHDANCRTFHVIKNFRSLG